jgi:hypothetical protein
MKSRLTILSVGVDDLEGSLTFYRDGLGLPTDGIVGTEYEHGAVAFFDLEPGLMLAIWPRRDLAHDFHVPQEARSTTGLTIDHRVNSKAEVDAVMAQAKKAGAKILKPAGETLGGGYAGSFQDPDDHVWEVAWNPRMQIAE